MTDFQDWMDSIVAERALLDHPFYRAWDKGELTKEQLRDYAEEYFAHVRSFPTYLSLTHAQCDDPNVRRDITENLVEEELGAGDTEDHLTLWLDFAEELGADRERVANNSGCTGVRQAIAQFRAVCFSSTLEGLAALYAYESQIPEVSRTKIDGLQDYYGIDSDKALRYFRVHEEADRRHRDEEAALLEQLYDSDDDRQKVEAALRTGAEAAWMILDGICEKHYPELTECAAA